MDSLTLITKHADDKNIISSKGWEIWEWNESEFHSHLLIAHLRTLNDIKSYVESEIKRIHPKIDESIINIDSFKKDVPQRGTIEQEYMHIIYQLPIELNSSNKLKLMRTCNDEFILGLTAYRYRTNPNVEYD